MRDAASELEPPPEPLDDREPEDGTDDFGELLPGLEEEPLNEEDEREGTGSNELDDLTALEESAEGDLPLDELEVGPDSVLPEAEDEDAGDAAGLDDPAAADAISEDALPPDDEEKNGIDDTRPLVNELDLPGLDADEGGAEDDARFGDFLAASELVFPAAAAPWRVTRLSPERERCDALALGAGSAVAGSTDLLWLDAGRTQPVRLALEGSRIVNLLLVGEQGDTVLALTASGRLLRRARLATEVERALELGPRAELGGPETRRVELCPLDPQRPRALLVRLASGLLGESTDAGSSLTPLDPPLKARALAGAAGQNVALGEDGGELILFQNGVRNAEPRRLDGRARAIGRGEEPLLAYADGVLGLADTERGLVLSTDGGASFRNVEGCAALTACAVGARDAEPRAWVSLYSETEDTTRIIELDPKSGTGELVATISGTGDGSEDSAGGRIERLAWDGTRLFAVGEPGFLLLEPAAPDSAH